jgi:hypothetical protein
MKDIISKYTVMYKNHRIAISDENRVYDLNTGIELIEELNNGVLCYRYRKSTKRIGLATIKKHKKPCVMTIKQYCPF